MTREPVKKRIRKKKNRSREIKSEFTHSAIFFLIKPKEDLAGGTKAAKTSPPLGGRSGVARTGAPEELSTGATKELGTGATEEPGAGASEKLVSDDRLLQRDQDQCQNKKEGFNYREIRQQLTAA